MVAGAQSASAAKRTITSCRRERLIVPNDVHDLPLGVRDGDFWHGSFLARIDRLGRKCDYICKYLHS